MKELTLKELREQYPDIKATSKADFISKIPVEGEVIEVEVKEDKYELKDLLTWYTIEQYLDTVAKTQKKILIKVPSAIEADLLFAKLNKDYFPKANKDGIKVMASSTRRDFHLNGTCYVRLVCIGNYEHMKRLIAYNTFKELV